MNRIKFRAYDTISKRWLDANELAIDLSGDWLFFDGTEYYPVNNYEYIILMQYIDLEDKNGTGIYEGDIIQLFYGDMKDGKPQIVKWDGFCFWPFNNGCRGCETHFMRILNNFTPDPKYPYIKQYSIEIIGNIYENKELLND